MKFKTMIVVLVGFAASGVGIRAGELEWKPLLYPTTRGIKVVEWSAHQTDEKTRLRYRIGLTQEEVVLQKDLQLGVFIEIGNTGDEDVYLHAYESRQLVTWLYIDDKRLATSPLVGDAAVSEPILLRSGESWVQLHGFLVLGEGLKPGKHEVVVAFGIAREAGDPLELKSAPLTVEFKRDTENKLD